jgi:hypothetical protein
VAEDVPLAAVVWGRHASLKRARGSALAHLVSLLAVVFSGRAPWRPEVRNPRSRGDTG